jgi:hypothetical protein
LTPSIIEKPLTASTFWTCLLQERLDLLNRFAGAGDRSPIRQLDRDKERALIFIGQEPGRRAQRQQIDRRRTREDRGNTKE